MCFKCTHCYLYKRSQADVGSWGNFLCNVCVCLTYYIHQTVCSTIFCKILVLFLKMSLVCLSVWFLHLCNYLGFTKYVCDLKFVIMNWLLLSCMNEIHQRVCLCWTLSITIECIGGLQIVKIVQYIKVTISVYCSSLHFSLVLRHILNTFWWQFLKLKYKAARWKIQCM